jgi:putative ABC transport system permease protein
MRYAVRILRKNPGFSFAAVLALTLGIGANTAIFSIVNAVVFRPLPYKDPDRLVMLGYAYHEASPGNFLEWRERNHVFESMAALQFWTANLTGDDNPVRLYGYAVSPSLFPMLGVQPALGRAFAPDEEEPGKDNVVILSHALWQSRFGSDPALIGKTLTINGKVRTVVGVMPPNFQFYEPSQIWIPLPFDADDRNARKANYLIAVARLKPGVTLQSAQADMTNIARVLEQQYPETNTNAVVKLVPLYDVIVGSIRPALLMLMGAVIFVLLIACANVANLLLAHSASRQKEIAIRVAIGAGRFRLIQQLMTESILLSMLGGVAGLLMAIWLTHFLVATMPESAESLLPRLKELTIDGRVLGFTLFISVLTGVVFGLAPALQISRPDLNETLKEGSKGVAGGFRGRRLRSLLVVTEVALSLILLISAGLMIRSFVNLLEVNPGFNTNNILTARISLSPQKYRDAGEMTAFYQQVLERIKTLPGVQGVGLVSNLPIGGGDQSGGFIIEGQPAPKPGEMPIASIRIASPDYFRTLGIPIIRGRSFTEQDTSGQPAVVLINETLAHQYWPKDDPIGKRVKNPGQAGTTEPPWLTIIGVVGDIKHGALTANPKSELYFNYLQGPARNMVFVIHTASEPLALGPAVRAQVLSVDKEQPLSDIRSLDEIISDSVYLNRFSMVLLGIFATVALILATVGIYGVMSYAVTQRTHEIGIRMALGAEPRDILRLVVKQGLMLGLIGIGLGLLAAFAVTRVMESLLYGVGVSDPLIFVAVSLLMAVVACLASYIPARRATRVNPLIALRYE